MAMCSAEAFTSTWCGRDENVVVSRISWILVVRVEHDAQVVLARHQRGGERHDVGALVRLVGSGCQGARRRDPRTAARCPCAR